VTFVAAAAAFAPIVPGISMSASRFIWYYRWISGRKTGFLSFWREGSSE
jgi:hypothetical protein